MTETTPTIDTLDKACMAVGRFLLKFAHLEKELDKSIAKLFSLPESYAAIISSNIDFSKKVTILKSALLNQTALDGPEAKKEIDALFNKVRGINDPHRVRVAHAHFEPVGTDAIAFGNIRIKPGDDTRKTVIRFEDFDAMILSMERLALEIRAISNKIRPHGFSLNRNNTTNEELRNKVAAIALKMRELESHYRNEQGKRIFGARGQEEYMLYQMEMTNSWATTLLPEAQALLEELHRRVGRSEDQEHEFRLTAIDHGMLAGPSPLAEAAQELERLARSLVDDIPPEIH